MSDTINAKKRADALEYLKQIYAAVDQLQELSRNFPNQIVSLDAGNINDLLESNIFAVLAASSERLRATSTRYSRVRNDQSNKSRLNKG